MTLKELTPVIRQHLSNHDNVFTVTIDEPYNDGRFNGDFLVSAACGDDVITYDSNDYLWYSIASLDYKQAGRLLTFYVTYYSTQEEEQQAISALDGLAASLNVRNLSIPDSIRAFYNWVADNVVYDTSSKTITRYTSTGETSMEAGRNSIWDVVVNKKAVCQGVAGTMYYFINKYITECRVIQGNEIGNTFKLYYHTWNIAKINDYWYYLDATAAIERHSTDPASQESWLLKNAYDFMHIANAAKYVPLPGYMRNEWLNKYGNISETSWAF